MEKNPPELRSRAGKYLLYAIGEIVLVVIGILIALQINNANELRKLKKQEQNYLIALSKEFEYNKKMLENVMRNNERYGDAAFELLKHTGPEQPSLAEKEFSKLILRTVSSEVMYLPSSGVLDEIISSGKLDLFQNQELKNLLSSWSGVMFKVRFQETELTKYRMELTDLWMKHGNSRRAVFESYDSLFGVDDSRFPVGNKHLLNSVQFENNLEAFLYSSRFANKNYYSNLEEKIISILEIINAEIE
jgi:hypothetical protein